MNDLISREDLIDWLTSGIIRLKGIYGDLGGAVSGVREMVKVMPSAEPERKKGMMTNHEVACLLADLFDDPCACNFNGIDEWLPEKCELQESCPNPVGVACWEQFLKYRGDVSLGNSEK